MSSIYSYEPLESPDTIRVLELLPGRDSDRIQCELRRTTRSEAPQYEALSYAWGDLSEKTEISCGGSKLEIQKNLYDFLKRLRDPVESKIYWADAICINQTDLAEVGHQVRQMASIYSGAERVIVWLGREDPSKYFGKDEKPLERLEHIYKSPNLDNGRGGFRTRSLIADDCVETRSFLTAVIELLKRPWFQRLWVVQEAGLGKSVVALFGEENQELNFDDWIRLVLDIEFTQHELFNYWQIWVPFIFGTFTNRYAPSRFKNKPDFLELLHISKTQDASDPRDFVFALLAHPSAQASSGLIIEPNYHKSHWEIFHELAVTLLMRSKNLRVLSAVRHSNEDELEGDYPSWIPTWQRGRHHSPLGVFQDDCNTFDAHARFPRELQFTNMNKTIQVGGFAFDTIDEYTEVFGFEMRETARGQVSFNRWPITDALAFGAISAMPTQEKLKNVFGALIPFYRLFSKEWAKERMRDFAAFRLQLSRSEYSPAHNESYALLPEGLAAAEKEANEGSAQDFVDTSKDYVLHKRLFTTKSGLVGLGPHLLRSGDICCILYGGHIPFLLRPVGSAYKLVGEIWIEKVMQGEAVVDFVLGDMYEAQTFTII